MSLLKCEALVMGVILDMVAIVGVGRRRESWSSVS